MRKSPTRADMNGMGFCGPDPSIEHGCIRCGENPQVDEQGYCGRCHWAVRAEVEEGSARLGEYLGAWARFAEWCTQRGREV